MLMYMKAIAAVVSGLVKALLVPTVVIIAFKEFLSRHLLPQPLVQLILLFPEALERCTSIRITIMQAVD
jgi:hypothetical protein